MEVKGDIPTSPTGQTKPVTKDALVQALKQYQGHDIKKALKLINKEGAKVSAENNSITISNGGKSLTIELGKTEASKPIGSFNFTTKSTKDKDMQRITDLADKILSKAALAPQDSEKTSPNDSPRSVSIEESRIEVSSKPISSNIPKNENILGLAIALTNAYEKNKDLKKAINAIADGAEYEVKSDETKTKYTISSDKFKSVTLDLNDAYSYPNAKKSSAPFEGMGPIGPITQKIWDAKYPPEPEPTYQRPPLSRLDRIQNEKIRATLLPLKDQVDAFKEENKFNKNAIEEANAFRERLGQAYAKPDAQTANRLLAEAQRLFDKYEII